MLLAWPADVHVHMVEPVDGTDQLACSEARAAFDPQALQLSAVMRGCKARIFKQRVATSTGADVDVCDVTDAQPLVERTHAVVRERARDDAVADRVDTRA